MDVNTYADVLRKYHAASSKISALQYVLTEAQGYLGKYNAPVSSAGDVLEFKPQTRMVSAKFDAEKWPTSEAIMGAAKALETAGKDVVDAYNALGREDRRLVARPV